MAVLILLLALMGGGYRYTFTDWATIRYRMTVTVDTPDGVRTGSAVHEFSRYETADWLLPLNTATSRIRGEAAVVDLGERGVLFVTYHRGRELPGATLVDWLGRKVAGVGVHESRFEQHRRIAEAAKAGAALIELDSDDIPFMARFRDPADPMTVEAVNPANLAARFGEGVALRSVTVQITRDAPQSVILKWLPWLPQYRTMNFDMTRVGSLYAPNRLANALGAGSFSNIYGD